MHDFKGLSTQTLYTHIVINLFCHSKKEKNDILESILIMFQRAPLGFEVGMKLEVVDKRNPILIRVASIVDTDGHLVKIHFDGWADSYDYWLDDDCMDIHPPGWCAKTGHPLTPPIC